MHDSWLGTIFCIEGQWEDNHPLIPVMLACCLPRVLCMTVRIHETMLMQQHSSRVCLQDHYFSCIRTGSTPA